MSMAVRKPREGEEEGIHYRFQGKADAFKKMLEKGEIIADTTVRDASCFDGRKLLSHLLH